MTLAGTLFYCKLLLNGASHDTKIGCVRLVSTEANKYKCSFLSFAGPLRTCVSWERVFGSRLEFFFLGGGGQNLGASLHLLFVISLSDPQSREMYLLQK